MKEGLKTINVFDEKNIPRKESLKILLTQA